MGENSKIEGTHHTFNIVWGCAKVSPACTHCYAEAWAKRTGHDVRGVNAPRKVMSAHYWRQPLKWNAAAERAGERRRVFCSSMADVFEDHPTLHGERKRLWELIEQTPWLDWLLLTKRPENIRGSVPTSWLRSPLRNVWLGTTIESQEYLERRAMALLSTPARVHIFSCEPLLGPLDIKGFRPAWVICGGESGGKARPMHPDWARSLRDQCQAKGVAFHFKQWGDLVDVDTAIKAHGFNPYTEHPAFYTIPGYALPFTRVGKNNAGRLLDGRTWDELPHVAPTSD